MFNQMEEVSWKCGIFKISGASWFFLRCFRSLIVLYQYALYR